MDTKLLLIRIITLLFLESQILKKGNASSKALIVEALTYIKTAEAVNIADFSKDPLTKLKEIAVWMTNQPAEYVFDKNDLAQRVRVATENEEYIFDAAMTNILPDMTVPEMQKIISTNREEINVYINKAIVTGIVKDAYQKAAFRPDQIDWSNYAKELIAAIEPYKTIGETDKSTLVKSINLTDISSLTTAFQEGLAEISHDGVIRFHLQGLNRMFGDQGGGRRGEMIVIGALQHNFKSGLSLEMLKGAALYNKPYMRDPNKKPLILRFSFENPAIKDILDIYKSLMEAETGILIDVKTVDPIAAAIYVNERLSVNGYTVIFEQHNPSDVTYHKLFSIIEEYEDQGYEIHMLNLDYLAMISTKGCKQGATGQDIRDLYRRVRNFVEPKGILCITPHQLSVDAKKKTRDGVDPGDFVREIANKGYWDSCSTIDQEVDMEIYVHLVRIGNDTYITLMRGKHRKAGNPTPFEDYYTVYKFGTVGFIPDDVLGVDMSRKKVGASTAGGGAGEWWSEAA